MMLEYPDYSNDIISAECGFSCRTHLYRIFKNKAGCSPTEWRNLPKGVAFLGMLLLFGRNATLFQGNATPFFSENTNFVARKKYLNLIPSIKIWLSESSFRKASYIF